MDVVFFRHILKFGPGYLERLRDQRTAARYRIGDSLPLKASINLLGDDAPSRTRRPGEGRDWGGRAVDISHVGISLLLSRAALARRGEQTRLRLNLGGRELVIPCTVAYVRAATDQSRCGLTLQFPDDWTRMAYLQLREAVLTGSTLKPRRTPSLSRNPPGLKREQYVAENGARLLAWRKKKGGELVSFEFLMQEHGLRGEAGTPGELKVYAPQGSGVATAFVWSDSNLVLSPDEHAELREFFRWIVPNITTAVPEDLRELMRDCAG